MDTAGGKGPDIRPNRFSQVLSDSKDAYTDAEWVPQFVSGLLSRLDPARARELVQPFV